MTHTKHGDTLPEGGFHGGDEVPSGGFHGE